MSSDQPHPIDEESLSALEAIRAPESACDAATLSAEVRRQRLVIQALVDFVKDAYCFRSRFDTCADAFCIDAREELSRILAIEAVVLPTLKTSSVPGQTLSGSPIPDQSGGSKS